jgi:hypothetical protein
MSLSAPVVFARFDSPGVAEAKAGVRVIYYFHTVEKPIYLLEIFGKNERANLTAAQRNALARVAAEIKQQLQRRQR